MSATNLPLWLTEDVTWPILWGVLAIGVFGFIWYVTQKTPPLILALVSLLVVVGSLVIELQVETDREKLTNAVYKMADAVRNNDADGVAAFVSDTLPELKRRIHSEKEKFTVTSCSVNGFRKKELLPNEFAATEANIGFSVYGSGAHKAQGFDYSGLLAVDLKFKKINGKWSIVKFSYYPTIAPNLSLIHI